MARVRAEEDKKELLLAGEAEIISNVHEEIDQPISVSFQCQSDPPTPSPATILAKLPTAPQIRCLRPKLYGRIVAKVPKGVQVIPPKKSRRRSGIAKTDKSAYERFEASLRPLPLGLPSKPTSLPVRAPDKSSGESNDSVAEDPEEHSLKDEQPHSPSSAKLIEVLANTSSVTDAWNAYQILMTLPTKGTRLLIPWEYLHRLARLIASTKPRTRTLFIRLLSVISTINTTGGKVALWEWNALIDFAGKGWRKTRQEDYKTSVGIFKDLVAQRAPGSTLSRDQQDFRSGSLQTNETPAPDIITYTTLLNIAARTLHQPTFRHASSMLQASGETPNRITLLATMRYHARMGDLSKVRQTILQIRDLGFELGLDGINSCIWSYARNARLDVASAIYFILKCRENGCDENDAHLCSVKEYLMSSEGFDVPLGIVPDHITYIGLLQSYAYHGDLIKALQVFADMVTSLAPDNPSGEESIPDIGYMVPAYRAIFLGFVRNAKSPTDLILESHLSHRLQTRDSPSVDSFIWSLDALEALFDDFMGLDWGAKPSERNLYWILVAYARTTGDDVEKLKQVYERLEKRFGGGWGGRIARLKKRLYK